MILSYLFSCRHDHHTWPRTIRGSRPKPEAAMVTGTYIACTDCGKEMPYDLDEMRVLTSKRQARAYLAAVAAGILLLSILSCGKLVTKPTASHIDVEIPASTSGTMTITLPSATLELNGHSDFAAITQGGRTILSCKSKKSGRLTDCKLEKGSTLDDLVNLFMDIQAEEHAQEQPQRHWTPISQYDHPKNKL